jgi:hypothetical protein
MIRVLYSVFTTLVEEIYRITDSLESPPVRSCNEQITRNAFPLDSYNALHSRECTQAED